MVTLSHIRIKVRYVAHCMRPNDVRTTSGWYQYIALFWVMYSIPVPNYASV